MYVCMCVCVCVCVCVCACILKAADPVLGPLFSTECAYVCGKIFFPREILREKKNGATCAAPPSQQLQQRTATCAVRKSTAAYTSTYIQTDRQSDIRTYA
jgi:hypothetical protein